MLNRVVRTIFEPRRKEANILAAEGGRNMTLEKNAY
jgi:hypothetical protein